MSGNNSAKSTASIAENTLLAKKKRGFPFKKVFFALLIVLIVFSILLLSVNIIINSYFSKVKEFDGNWQINLELMKSMPMYADNEGYFAQSEELHAAYDRVMRNYAQASADIRYDESVYNYAVFGTDQFAGSSEAASADIIMIVSVDEDKDHVTYLSFETKMLVYIPSVGVGPMSDAYLLGGPQLLVNTIEQNYGLHLDGFVQLDMTAFSEMVDNFGGLEFAADQKLVDRINLDIVAFNEAKNLTGDASVKGVKLEGNKVMLNGQQTLAYIRNAGTDKSNIANSVLSKLTAKIVEAGLGGIKDSLDISLEKMMVSFSRDDVGPLISIGFSVLETVNAIPVGVMDGREAVMHTGGYVCEYPAERAAVIKTIYN